MRRKTLPLRTKALAVPQTTGTGWPLTSPTEGSPRPTKINPVRLLYASGRAGDVNLFFWDEGCSDGKPARGKPQRPDSRRLLAIKTEGCFADNPVIEFSLFSGAAFARTRSAATSMAQRFSLDRPFDRKNRLANNLRFRCKPSRQTRRGQNEPWKDLFQ